MNEHASINRPITLGEVAVVQSALERAPILPESSRLMAGVEHLRAIAQCICGCDSVDFVPHNPAQPAKPIANGIGTTEAGGMVGVIVWGTQDTVTSLEIYDLGAGPGDVKLPKPETIRRFQTGAV